MITLATLPQFLNRTEPKLSSDSLQTLQVDHPTISPTSLQHHTLNPYSNHVTTAVTVGVVYWPWPELRTQNPGVGHLTKPACVCLDFIETFLCRKRSKEYLKFPPDPPAFPFPT